MIYTTITGRAFDLKRLKWPEAAFLKYCLGIYRTNPDVEGFGRCWKAEAERTGLPPESVAHRVAQDLETRLGIQQGRCMLPGFMEYIRDKMSDHESKAGFCQTMGILRDELDSVLAPGQGLTVALVERVLAKTGAVLTVQAEKEAHEACSPARAVEMLKFLK